MSVSQPPAWILRIRALDRVGRAALLVLLLYAALVAATETGAGVAGRGLDPVWSAAQARGTLRVAVDYGFRPFTDIQGDQPQGYDIDLARAVAGKLGLRAEFVPSGLDSVYDDLASGKADLAASALPYAPEQGWRARFSEFYFNAGQVLVVPDGSAIVGEGDLNDLRVCVALGSDADTYARSLAGRRPIALQSQFDAPSDAFAALRAGGCDAVIADNLSALIELASAPGLRLTVALTLEPYALVIPVAGFRMQAEVNRALADLRREGFFDEIGQRWFR